MNSVPKPRTTSVQRKAKEDGDVELTQCDLLKLILSEPFSTIHNSERVSSEGFAWIEGEDVEEVVGQGGEGRKGAHERFGEEKGEKGALRFSPWSTAATQPFGRRGSKRGIKRSTTTTNNQRRRGRDDEHVD